MLQRMRMLNSSVRIAARIPRIGSQIFFSRTAGTVPIRDERFSQLTEADISFFRNTLGDTGLITDESSLEAYNHDWMGKYTGTSKLALRPKTTEQVSEILAYCNERMLAVVPQGGNTGLVGGSIPIFDEVILSTSAMNQIESVDEVGGTVVCQSGAVLESISNHVAEYGFTVPLDLGAKGSCQIGGNVSTNAGGLRLLRYGSLHGTVLGLEVWTYRGAVLQKL
ncbi:D-2-hydroxyglutarate dehydrogenase, mitochondrial [Cymbomonas tetramitiformis]|uniref:D-2-hydroxyglutarate dehydrogenase, mitochondrial n=1 Tax=Cymbomonas tetramitiformis TaxID=36881 RepID=A0AAE0GJ63_9CHLO|nr:D-2-hydroxyglutarate dehydrogenase, mitochondrial [Cymbomonas tetramitiformis]